MSLRDNQNMANLQGAWLSRTSRRSIRCRLLPLRRRCYSSGWKIHHPPSLPANRSAQFQRAAVGAAIVCDQRHLLQQAHTRHRDPLKTSSRWQSLPVRCEWSRIFYRSTFLRTSGVRFTGKHPSENGYSQCCEGDYNRPHRQAVRVMASLNRFPIQRNRLLMPLCPNLSGSPRVLLCLLHLTTLKLPMNRFN